MHTSRTKSTGTGPRSTRTMCAAANFAAYQLRKLPQEKSLPVAFPDCPSSCSFDASFPVGDVVLEVRWRVT
jgi:hypothetical protein